MLPMFMFDLIFLEILPRFFLDPPTALLLDCPLAWMLKLIPLSLFIIWPRLRVPVTPAEFIPETLPE